MTDTPYPDTSVLRPIRLDGAGAAHALSHWAATSAPWGHGLGAVAGEIRADVAIIGGGYTGLSAAYHLGLEHGISAVVLEANRVGWGGSGRNAGFVLPTFGLDDHGGDLEQKMGTARVRFDIGQEAVRTVEAVLDLNHLDVDRTARGWLNIAHRPSRLRALAARSDFLARAFGYRTDVLSRADLAARYYDSAQSHGALLVPDAFGINPLAYATGLADAARAQGARIHEASPVLGWSKTDGRHQLRCPGGTVAADTVFIATGGYTLDALTPWVAGRVLPALSCIIATRRLSPAEQRAAGLLTNIVANDTRELVHYFRLLPDGRFLFGGRGELTDTPAARARALVWLRTRMADMFPALARVEITHCWSGWICLSRDLRPHLGTTDDPSVHFALAYMGNGVALATHFGRLVAARIAGRTLTDCTLPPPGVPPRFPLASLRPMLLGAAYLAYGIKDRV